MDYKELAKFKFMQYSKIGTYKIEKLEEEQDRSFFISTDASGVKRIHEFTPFGSTIQLYVEQAKKSETVIENVESTIKKVVKKIISKKKDK